MRKPAWTLLDSKCVVCGKSQTQVFYYCLKCYREMNRDN